MRFASKSHGETSDPKKKAVLDFAVQGASEQIHLALIQYYCDYGLGEKYGGRSEEWKGVKQRVDNLCGWLKKNESALLAEFRGDIESGRAKLKISEEQAKNNGAVIFLAWAAPRYLLEMENPGGDFFLNKEGKKPRIPVLVVHGLKDGAVGEIVDEKKVKNQATSGFLDRKKVDHTILEWESLDEKGNDQFRASRMVNAFNCGVHEYSHRYNWMLGKDETISEIGTALAVLEYGLPAFFQPDAPHSYFTGTRDMRGTVREKGLAGKELLGLFYNEYFETSIAPYVASYLKEKNGKAPQFHEFVEEMNAEKDEHRGFLTSCGIADQELFAKLERILKELLPDGFSEEKLPKDNGFPARFFERMDAEFPEIRLRHRELPREILNIQNVFD
jgi:hypothetical protein